MGKSTSAIKPGGNKSASKPSSKAQRIDLEKEITLLGGTKADLELIAGIDEDESGSENEYQIFTNVCE